MLVGRPNKQLEHSERFDLDAIWEFVFNLPPNDSVAEAMSRTNVCPDATVPLLALLHSCLQTPVSF